MIFTTFSKSFVFLKQFIPRSTFCIFASSAKWLGTIGKRLVGRLSCCIEYHPPNGMRQKCAACCLRQSAGVLQKKNWGWEWIYYFDDEAQDISTGCEYKHFRAIHMLQVRRETYFILILKFATASQHSTTLPALYSAHAERFLII